MPDPRLAVGQTVLFWVTGSAGAMPTPGLWGAGVVTGRHRIGRGHEDCYWRTPPSEPGSSVWIPVDVALFDAPIPRAALADDPRLRDLQILRGHLISN